MRKRTIAHGQKPGIVESFDAAHFGEIGFCLPLLSEEVDIQTEATIALQYAYVVIAGIAQVA